jgi:DNA segregation ATPase FtsK/SpoIIIE, S-DNA-T family
VHTSAVTAHSTLDVAVRRTAGTDDVTLHLSLPGATIGDIAAALGLPRRAIDVDGRVVDGSVAVGDAGLRRGSVLGSLGDAAAAPAVAVLRSIAGVDAGSSAALVPGRHVLGRTAGADVHCRDPRVAPFAAVVDVAADGAVAITPMAPGLVAVAPGRWRLGGGVFEVTAPRRARLVPTGPGRPGEWTVPVARPPRPASPPRPGGARPPAAADTVPAPIPVSGLVTALLTLAGGVVAAVAFGQPGFLLLGGTGALVAVGAWIAQRRRGRRAAKSARRRARADRERFEADIARHRDEAAAWLRARAVELPDAAARATTHDARLWERRRSHDDAFEVVLGRGNVPWAVAVDTGAVEVGLEDVPVTIRLEPGVVVGVIGPMDAARAVARALVVQLGVTMGPADLGVSVVADDAPTAWAWTAWLPHAVDLSEPAPDRPRLVVVDAVDALATRTSPVRVALASSAGVVVGSRSESLPACCTHLVEVDGDARGRLVDLGTGAVVDNVLGAGVSVATATAAARALARFDDPELARPDARLPARVDLLDLLGSDALDPVSVVSRWQRSDAAVRAPLAVAADGVVEIGLVEHGPHALLAGTTGAGKSELLRTLVAALAVRASPADVTFVLVDYKGGSAFDACAGLPHVVGVVTDLDERLAERALRSLRAELRRRERLLRAAGAVDIDAYRAAGAAEPMPRLVVVVDEFAGLATELPDFLASLVGVAQRGRSLGVHLVLATQRPAGVVSDDIRANTNLRIALRVQDGSDSVDVIGTDDAARLARHRPGRAMVRLGAGELVPVQIASVGSPVATSDGPAVVVTAVGATLPPTTASGPSTLDRLVAAVHQAADMAGLASPRRPWLDPLPAELDLDDLPPGTVALADDPDEPAQPAVEWDRSGGHLLLYGAPGSGTTTALISIALAITGHTAPEVLHVYAVDMGAAGLQPVAGLPHCGGVLRATERERLVRLVRRLRCELDRRRSAARILGPDIVLFVDGLEALRARFDDPAGYEVLDALDAVIQDGPDIGIRMVATADRAGAVPVALLAAVGDRWIFRLADPADARSFGLAPARVAGLPAGRAVMARRGLELHVARPASVVGAVAAIASQRGGGGGPAPIGVLPAAVPAASLPVPSTACRPWSLPIGIADADLQPAPLVLHGGDHVLVMGRARTGRSSALAVIAGTIRRAVPDAVIGAVAFRPSPVRDLADVIATNAIELGRMAEASVVLVDDAELVTDDGTLAAVLIGADRHLVAAVHPDVLRSTYGHWAHAVRRSRLGVVLQPDLDVDGDLLGTVLPRRQVVPARPGCGYLVVDGRAELVQLAHVA